MATVKKCHLLALPAELRNKIYDLAFSNVIVDIDILPRSTPSLLLACKQTFSEAWGAYWRNSIFNNRHPHEISPFLEGLEAQSSRLITTLNCDADYLTFPRRTYERAANAQSNTFWIIEKLAEKEIIEYRADAISCTFRTPGGEVTRSATPWLTFAHLYETNTYQLTAEDEEQLKRYIPRQNRFFEHDHQSDLDCWHQVWMYDPDYICACPKKEDLSAIATKHR